VAHDSIAKREIHLRWAVMTDADPLIGDLRCLLDDRERERAGRFRIERAARRFVVARATLRQVLGEVIGSKPEDIAFSYGPRGKPSLPESHLHFNASDSGDVVVIGLALEELGVDIEVERRLRRADRLAERVCNPEEHRRWSMIPEVHREPVLLRLWTCKEAILKAAGTGLSGGMANAGVDLQPDGSAPRAAFSDQSYTLLPIRLPLDLVGTVAIGGNGWRIVPSRVEF
jgi:4'-phosphopantetheinyl transferase